MNNVISHLVNQTLESTLEARVINKRDAPVDEIEQDLKRGISVERIIEVYNCSRRVVLRIRRDLSKRDNNNSWWQEGLHKKRSTSLTTEQVNEMFKLFADGVRNKDICKKFNRSPATISKYRQRWINQL